MNTAPLVPSTPVSTPAGAAAAPPHPPRTALGDRIARGYLFARKYANAFPGRSPVTVFHETALRKHWDWNDLSQRSHEEFNAYICEGMRLVMLDDLRAAHAAKRDAALTVSADEAGVDSLPDPTGGLAPELADQVDTSLRRRALDELARLHGDSHAYRTAMRFHELEAKGYKSIKEQAKALGKLPNTLSIQRSRALRKLAPHFKAILKRLAREDATK